MLFSSMDYSNVALYAVVVLLRFPSWELAIYLPKGQFIEKKKWIRAFVFLLKIIVKKKLSIDDQLKEESLGPIFDIKNVTVSTIWKINLVVKKGTSGA